VRLLLPFLSCFVAEVSNSKHDSVAACASLTAAVRDSDTKTQAACAVGVASHVEEKYLAVALASALGSVTAVATAVATVAVIIVDCIENKNFEVHRKE